MNYANTSRSLKCQLVQFTAVTFHQIVHHVPQTLSDSVVTFHARPPTLSPSDQAQAEVCFPISPGSPSDQPPLVKLFHIPLITPPPPGFCSAQLALRSLTAASWLVRLTECRPANFSAPAADDCGCVGYQCKSKGQKGVFGNTGNGVRGQAE